MANRHALSESTSSDLVIIENEVDNAEITRIQPSHLKENVRISDAPVLSAKGVFRGARGGVDGEQGPRGDAATDAGNAEARKRSRSRRKAVQKDSKVGTSLGNLTREELTIAPYRSKRKASCRGPNARQDPGKCSEINVDPGCQLPNKKKRATTRKGISEPGGGDRQSPGDCDAGSSLEQVHNATDDDINRQMICLTDKLFQLNDRLREKDCSSQELLNELSAEVHRISGAFATQDPTCGATGSNTSRASPDELGVFGGRLDYIREKISYLRGKLPHSDCTIDGEISVLGSKINALRRRFSDLNGKIGTLAGGDDVLRRKSVDFSKRLDTLCTGLSALKDQAALSGRNGIPPDQDHLGGFLDEIRLKTVYLYGEISYLNEKQACLAGQNSSLFDADSSFYDSLSSFGPGPADDMCDRPSSEGCDLVVLASEIEEASTNEQASASDAHLPLPQCEWPLGKNGADAHGMLVEPAFGREKDAGSEPAPSYKIIFKKGSYSKQWVLGADDSVEVLYDDLFGKGSTRIICLEGLLVSQHLSVSENGFFPGTNYITLSEDDREGVKAFSEAVVQMDCHPKNNFHVQFSPDTTVGDILEKIAGIRALDPRDLQVVFNGLLLEPEKTFGDAVEDGDVVDVIQPSGTGPVANVQ